MAGQMCPACLQKTLIPAMVGSKSALRCQRCGGFLLDYKTLVKIWDPNDQFWTGFTKYVQNYSGRCHYCGGVVQRYQKQCTHCSYNLAIICQRHDRPMLGASIGPLKVDYCTECRDVWFDAHELAEVAVRNNWIVWDGMGPPPPGAEALVARSRRMGTFSEIVDAVLAPLNNLFR